MRYLVTGCTILNDMLYADGSRVEGFLGGAIYALNGIKPYCDDVILITTAGQDFDQFYGPYYRANQLSTAGVQLLLPKTHYNTVEYHPDGRWWEYSKYGPEFEAEWWPKSHIRAEYVTPFADENTRGIYFESGVREVIWRNLADLRKAAPNAMLMAELLTADANDPVLKPDLLALIGAVDIYSLNLPESLAFFGTRSETESIQAILALGKACFFRVGEKGAYMIQDGKAWFAPAKGVETSVDSTGCGNCSTGAALYGYAEGLHPLRTAVLANLAAGLNARQYGPYPLFTADLRADLLAQADAEFNRLFEEQ